MHIEINALWKWIFSKWKCNFNLFSFENKRTAEPDRTEKKSFELHSTCLRLNCTNTEIKLEIDHEKSFQTYANEKTKFWVLF